ncbi:MAG: TonB-dependent siderophore receptor [Goleter apudmare HA4340-LM2]|jgi:iron complex outermembrane receptor protein|nr:TonB-dependent siderophore receptor [Goleter apudmare HA4340-LM2]
MRSWCLSVRLSFLISLSGCLSILAVSSVWAGEKQQQTSSPIRQLSEIELPVTKAQVLVQSPTPSNTPVVPGSIVTITGVKANPTDKGVEVILETTLGEQLQITNRSAENNFIADIPNAQLRLPSGEAFTFRSEKPVAGITEITVTNVDVNTVRVTVVGENALPTVELFDDDAGLVFGVASTETATKPPDTPPVEEKPVTEKPQEKPDDPIELVVTGERDGYNVPNASTATRTDTPIRDIPQSIQVVPQEVLRDRRVRTVNEAVETVSGVADGGIIAGPNSGNYIIRGFRQSGTFRNGYRIGDEFTTVPIGTIERVEVLKGPASVLFGAFEPGGIVNVITRQPLSEPYYNLAFEAGSYGFYQPSIDFSGPLTTDKTLLYRFIASYQSSNGVQEFVNTNRTTIAPSITLNLGDRTSLNLYYEYSNFFGNPPEQNRFILLDDGSLPPRSFYPSYPGLAEAEGTSQKYGYELRHEFSDNWQIRNNFTRVANYTRFVDAFPTTIEDNRFLTGWEYYDGPFTFDNYFAQIDLLGKFNTGSISHQLLVGFDFNRNEGRFYDNFFSDNLPPLDLQNPNYDIPRPGFTERFDDSNNYSESYGIYLQDQIAFSDNLKLLIGGRYDWVSSGSENEATGEISDNPVQGAFSPRIGLVYQPSESVALYASYAQSFNSAFGLTANGEAFEPTRGTQYEVGIKADFLDSRLSTTLAAYHLTKTNILTPDPNNRRFSIQIGEQRSQGIELDVTGEILPGWKVIASYAYIDAKVTEDNDIPVGNRLRSVPEHQATLWTTYEIQKGDLRGLGFGFGLFYVGEKQGDFANSFQVDDYLRTDAALYYRRDGFKAAINIRNLFDTDYITNSYNRARIERGEPFTITGSISWEF